jgi:hypothetical protein
VRAFDRAERAPEDNVETGFLPDLAHGRLLDALAFLDTAARHDRGEIRLAGEVEDEKLVGTRLRVLAGDVDGDRRPRSQLCWARSFALYARFASW